LLSRPDLNRLEKRLAFFNLGVIRHQKGDVDKAIGHWNDVISTPVNTNDALMETEEIELAAAANMNLGAHYVLSNEMEKGLRYLLSARELDPDDGEIRYNLAATFAVMDRGDEAIKEFKAAEERGVEAATEVLGKIEKAIAENEQKAKEGQNAAKQK